MEAFLGKGTQDYFNEKRGQDFKLESLEQNRC